MRRPANDLRRAAPSVRHGYHEISSNKKTHSPTEDGAARHPYRAWR